MSSIRSTRILRLQATSPRIVPLEVSLSRETPIVDNPGGPGTVGEVSDSALAAAMEAALARQQALEAHNRAVEANSAADAAAAAAGQAQSAVSGKLTKSGSDILSGVINIQNAGGFVAGNVTINSAGVVSGTGMAMTQRGLAGVYGNRVKLALSNTGEATFSGDIDTDGSVYAYGINAQSVTFYALQNYTARPAGYFRQTSGPAGGIPCGVVGHATSLNSVGVAGIGAAFGVCGVASLSSGFGVFSSGNCLVLGNLMVSGGVSDANGNPLRLQYSLDNGVNWAAILLRKA
ncbi:MAG: hypothetical protein FWD77_04495 [Betaproteobacteria bacterium]|nr:hypothetical protein [Betaproteobacteria bacterium]